MADHCFCDEHGFHKAKMEALDRVYADVRNDLKVIYDKLNEISVKLAYENGKHSSTGKFEAFKTTALKNTERLSFLEGRIAGAAGLIALLIALAGLVIRLF